MKRSLDLGDIMLMELLLYHGTLKMCKLNIEKIADYMAVFSSAIVSKMRKQTKTPIDFNGVIQSKKEESLTEQNQWQQRFKATISRIKAKKI